MKLLLLAGNSADNRRWIEEVERVLAPHFERTHIHQYRHWSTGDELIDLEFELSELVRTVGDLDGWAVFAKSAGAILILRGCFEGRIRPSACVFAGAAIRWAQAQSMDVLAWLSEYRVPTLFIQKTSDPAISYADLADILRESVSAEVKEIPGDTHSYDDFHMLEEEVAGFVI